MIVLSLKLLELANWMHWKKTKDFTVSFLHNQPSVEPLIVDNQTLEVVNTIKLLGVYLSSDLKWTTHVRHISSKASKRLHAFRISILKRNSVQPSDLKTTYRSFIRPVLGYACPVWHTSLPKFLIDELEHIQKRALKIIVSHALVLLRKPDRPKVTYTRGEKGIVMQILL